MSEVPQRPRLRPALAASPAPAEPGVFWLHDRQRITHRFARVLRHEIAWAQLFDGQTTFHQIHARITGQGFDVTVDHVVELARRLDSALLLDSPALASYFTGPVREPSCIGAYPGDPDELRATLDGLFTESGLPSGPPPKDDRGLRAILAPHMDYGRGGQVYGHAFKELHDRSAARLFVIIATSHYSPERFTLSRQSFRTPLGVAPTDTAYVDRIADAFGEGAFADPLSHYPEHSIELEVVLLQHLYAGKRDFRIVPLLVGSFADAIRSIENPGQRDDIARMVAALRQAEAAAGEPVCYIISGDLAHIGPKFDDPDPVHPAQLAASRAQDHRLIRAAEAVDADGYFQVISAERDQRRICGLPPTWLTLAASTPSRGRLLRYEQYVEPTEGFESVSFASMAFDR